MKNCCDVEPVIVKSRNVAENDDTPLKETKLFCVMTLKCVNPQCPNFGKTWEEKIEMKLGE